MVEPTPSASFRFETERLAIGPWVALAEHHRLDLVEIVIDVLTPATTTSLPGPWQGRYDAARAARWITERNEESPTLLALDRTTASPVGLVILFESPVPGSAAIDLRIGYVLAERWWGQGLASEIVAGLVTWAGERTDVDIVSLSGGVASGNEASTRVLTRNGFVLEGADASGELHFVHKIVG